MMQRSISTHVFLRQRLHPGLLEALQRGGAQSIEIFANRAHFDYTDRSVVRDLAVWFRSNNVGATMHQPLYAESEWSHRSGPSVNLIDVEKSRRIDAMDEVKRALEAAEIIPLDSMVIHLGNRHEMWSPRAFEHSLTAIEHLKAFAHPLGVKLHIENLVSDVTRPENILEILNVGHFDSVGVCLDVGHANLQEGVENAIDTLGKRIKQLHLHDNHGSSDGTTKDEHLWPLAAQEPGTIAWESVMAKLNAMEQTMTGTLEIAHSLEETPESASAKAAAAFAMLEGSAKA